MPQFFTEMYILKKDAEDTIKLVLAGVEAERIWTVREPIDENEDMVTIRFELEDGRKEHTYD